MNASTLSLFAQTIKPTSSWSVFVSNFTAALTSKNSTLTIATAEETTVQWWLGSVSLMSVANTWRGMRKDVVDALKATGFKGLLRYPGFA